MKMLIYFSRFLRDFELQVGKAKPKLRPRS